MKSFWRGLHIDFNWIRIGKKIRFNKSSWKLINISKRTPNLVILGSQKCGTTSLYYYLKNHPEIAESAPFKEPGYFMFDKWARDFWERSRGLKIDSQEQLKLDYMCRNLADQKYFMDASTYYTQYLNESIYNIPEQIFDESKDVKLIYIIRNPFQRLISIYYHLKRHGYELEFEDCVNKDWHIETCLYYNRIRPYIDRFGRDSILITQMETLQNKPHTVLDRIWSFLDLKPIEYLDLITHNKTSLSDKLKFPESSYDNLLPLFSNQMKLLNTELGLSIDWNLKRQEWV